jgi:hypothetical protein
MQAVSGVIAEVRETDPWQTAHAAGGSGSSNGVYRSRCIVSRCRMAMEAVGQRVAIDRRLIQG